MTDSELDAYFASHGWNVVAIGTPANLGWESFCVWNPKTGIRMYTTAPTKVEAAAKMVMRFAGLTAEPRTGSVEGLKVALAGLRHALKAPTVKDDL